MFNWLREWYELQAYLAEKSKVCNSCEILKTELNNAHRLNESLMHQLLHNKSETEPIREATPETIPINRRHVSFNIKNQLMEAENRAKARAMANAAKSTISVEDLEQELDLVAAERENQSGKTANSK